MSAGKHKALCGGRKLSLTELEKVERYMFKLSRQVGAACDEFQLKRNGYKSDGFRSIINTSILEAQSKYK